MGRKLKTPDDYPTFIFRISEQDKADITRDIEAIKNQENKKKDGTRTTTKKNEVIVRALKIGLKKLLKSQEQK